MMKIAEYIRSNQNQDGSVVLDLLRGQMYGLNPVASAILELLGQGFDRDQIKSEIGRRFSTDAVTVDRDVNEFLSRLVELKVIDSNDGTPYSETNPSNPG